MPEETAPAAPAAPAAAAPTPTDSATPASSAAAANAAPSDDEPLGTAGRAALDAMKAERNAATTRARAAERELERVRQAGMSESEKAIAEAEARGRAAATTQYGERLARSEYVAAAAMRNPTFDATSMLDDLNIGRFIGEDGEPDKAEIKKSVERLVPAPSGAPSFDGGARQTAAATPGMDALIRAAARK